MRRALFAISLFIAPAGMAAPIVGPSSSAQQTAIEQTPFTNNIMLVGYWAPTNEMIRPFSTSSQQNPSGWTGGDWEGRGYDVYSYFPEFTSGNSGPGARGSGDFEVDYQYTDNDFARIVAEVRPLAIITFSWTAGRQHHGYADWELEARDRNRSTWAPDYLSPTQPTHVPPDPTMPADAERWSSLPMHSIRDAVNAQVSGVSSYIDDYSSTAAGSFLSEYLAYKALWYHDEHDDPYSDNWAAAAGHIHVGQNVSVAAGMAATAATLRVLTGYLDTVVGNDAMYGDRGLIGTSAPTSATAVIPAAPTAWCMLVLASCRAQRRRINLP